MCKYEVICKCGHVGKQHYIEISFPIIAENGREAAKKARYLPRVKHHHKDAIINVRKITDEEYTKLCHINDYDEYLHCTCKQEQNCIDLTDRIKDEFVGLKKQKNENHKIIFYGKEEVRKPKKFFKNLICNDYVESYI